MIGVNTANVPFWEVHGDIQYNCPMIGLIMAQSLISSTRQCRFNQSIKCILTPRFIKSWSPVLMYTLCSYLNSSYYLPLLCPYPAWIPCPAGHFADVMLDALSFYCRL